MMNWNGFSEYYDWEFSQVCNIQGEDIEMWCRFAAQWGGPILEVCCGSGRITLPLAKAGYEIYALDYSEKLLDILKSKIRADYKIHTIYADMRDFHIAQTFNFAFISYSSFQQLLTLDDQLTCLATINKHLNKNGKLIFDITPCLCEGDNSVAQSLQYTIRYPKNNSTVKLYSGYEIDRLNLIKHYYDKYVEIFANGEERVFSHSISLKECSPDYMKLILEKSGFRLVEIQGGFHNEKLDKLSNNAIYIAEKCDDLQR
jgi:ubiquinone/menaquinone biosynthesis C-methylase UbiE